MLKNYQERLKQINKLVSDAAKKVLNAHKIALDSFKNKDIDAFKSVAEMVKTLDNEARDIDNEVVKTIALFGPEASQLRELIAYIKLTNEIVRVGDYAKTYTKNMAKHIKNEIEFTLLDNYIVQLHESAIEALEYSLKMLNTNDLDEVEDLYRKTLVEESKTDEIFTLFEKELLENLCKDTTKLTDFLNVLSSCRKLERTGDRAVEIAKLLMFAKKGGRLENF
ncbi:MULTISPECIES: PhoU domain-containing protein [unclassified Nitratiruptor]|uniref:phosphate signaling complex PhoU family protein n=1 Tax=unclassified Nitratiruptor TaxID=2624044 RepID=UPI00191595BF|nr:MULTISPECIES: PhoU domain-containing protein [unclassified Nitratiruptor]BCD59879.1 phosphate transport system protein [Nitratiruptor sp. YY08-10]BCD63802.1 phosphate transport system protein [Nitratiruptor sp. YY08-14]